MQIKSTSPPWSSSARHTAIVIILVFVIWALWRFREFLAPVVWAVLISYILNPLVELLDERTPLKRGATIALILITLIGSIAIAIAALGDPLGEQVTALGNLLPGYIAQLTERFDQPLPVLGTNLHLGELISAASDQIGSAVSGFAGQTLQVAVQVAETIWQFILGIVITAYLLADFHKLSAAMTDVVPLPYREDFRKISTQLGRVWEGYLRGKVVLALVMGVITGTALAILGVRNALLLGVLAGLADFVPFVGATVIAVPIFLVAFFQDPGWLGISGWLFLALVAGVFLLIQWLEAQVLLPNIVGQSVRLHPLTVLIGLLMGASLAGVLGLLLAAPVIASLRVIGGYVWTKIWDESAQIEHPSPELLSDSVLNDLGE